MAWQALSDDERTDWAAGDIPAVIPKRLWDSMLDLQASIVAVAEAACRGAQHVIQAVRDGNLNESRLDELHNLMSETLTDLSKDTEELEQLRSLLKWVPPAALNVKH